MIDSNIHIRDTKPTRHQEIFSIRREEKILLQVMIRKAKKQRLAYKAGLIY
jgi:hypothetical protein